MTPNPMRTPTGWLADFARVQRELDRALDRTFGGLGMPASIRAASGPAFPAINLGSTPEAVHVFAFAPGLDASRLEVTVDHNLLTIAGERALARPDATSAMYAEERFSGSFRRVLTLPDDVDPTQVEATYRDGVLAVRVGRRAAVQPRRITVN